MVEKYNLYLDDERQPVLSFKLMEVRIGKDASRYINEDWVVVKDYPSFVRYVTENGPPDTVSFDHDLADAHYNEKWQNGVLDYNSEDFNKNYFKTGYHCAEWLINYCEENNVEFPTFYVHSMNPVGRVNIQALIDSYLTSKVIEAMVDKYKKPYEFAKCREIEEKIANEQRRNESISKGTVETNRRVREYVPGFGFRED